MSDWTDHADEIINVLQNAAVSNARHAATQPPPPGFDGVNCAECGEGIHPVRLKYGLSLCYDCAVFAARVERAAL